MAEGDTAQDRIDRILQILPLAARAKGIGYDELAAALSVSRRQLDRDLAEVTGREFYHTAGSGDDILVGLDPDRVRVWTSGQLRRPARLNLGEAAALDLGLRILAAEREKPELLAEMRALLERLAWSLPEPLTQRVIADGDRAAADAIRALVIDAARQRLRCHFSYLKPDAAGPEDRAVDPYAVACAEGSWYVVGHCPERGAVRAFRIDRILDASLGSHQFDPPDDFDPADHLHGGRVYRADDEIEVTVQYGGRAAPWLIERGEGQPMDDGTVIVRHRVADPAWLVRHVLQYGPEARVLEPADFADLVRDAATRIVEHAGG